MNVIEADVVKAVRAPVTPAYVRAVVARAAGVAEVAARLPGGTVTVAVRITDDAELRRLNMAYAGEDHATDVLSFEGTGSHVGDIAISWPRVVAQARRAGHSESRELSVLVVHGFLHLVGWDHRTPAEKKEMWRLTDAALAPRRRGYTPRSGLRRSPRA